MIQIIFALLIGFLYCQNECDSFSTYKTRTDALACFTTTPFSSYETTYQSIANDYSTSPDYYLDFAVFRQRIKAGPPHFTGSQIDLTAEMLTLETYAFDDWYTAELKLNDVFRLTRDAHFDLQTNTYVKWTGFFHPVGISSAVVGGVQKFYFATTGVADLTTIQTSYNSVYSTSHDFAALHGVEITSIDSKDPAVAIKELCDGYAYSRDDSTCLNELIRYLYWKRFIATYIGIPDSSVVYGYDSSTIDLDFVSCSVYSGITCDSIADNAAWATALDTYKRRSISETKKDFQTYDDILMERGQAKAKRIKEQLSATNKNSERRAASTTPICTHTCNSNEKFTVYKFDDDANTAVFFFPAMTTCDTQGETDTMVDAFKDCLKDNFAGGTYTKAILDLRENGGGTIFWGMYVISGLIRQTMPSTDYYLGPMVMTQHLKDDSYWDLTGSVEYNNENRPVRIVESDQSVSVFGSYVWWKSGITVSHVGTQATDIKAYTGFDGFEPDNFVVLLDGSCGSTCGMMVKILTGVKAARTVIYGGFYGGDFDVASFEGSGILNYAYTGGSNKVYSWSWGAYLNPTYDGLFDKNLLDLDNWSAFTNVNADHNVYEYDHFETSDLDGPYETLANFMDGSSCSSWGVKTDGGCLATITNGIYGKPCGQDGTWDDSAACVFKRCDDGYYINAARDECILLSEAPYYTNLDAKQTHCSTAGCNSEGTCDTDTGVCDCDGQFDDALCTECSDNYYGPSCDVFVCGGFWSNATVCNDHGTCGTPGGSCSCTGTWTGDYCEVDGSSGDDTDEGVYLIVSALLAFFVLVF